MNNKKKFILFVFSIVFIIILSIFIVLLFSQNSISKNREDTDSLNIVENTINEISNTTIADISTENLISNTQVENTTVQEVDTKVANNDTISAPSTSTNTSNKKNNSSTVKTTNSNVAQSNTTPVTEDTPKTTQQEIPNISNATTNIITENSSSNNSTVTPPKDEYKPELAHTSYRKVNTNIIPEVINILNSEIAKDNELVEFGTTALKGNKTDAYSKTTPFTYLYVNDITKGKIAGNYTTFTQRVKNNVGAFGKYYVYAEDEYVYDGRGLNPMWSQTLVWIYVSF